MKRIIVILAILYAHPSILFSQVQLTITGQVLSESSEPLPYAHIVIEGTKTGTLANANGDFILQLSEQDCSKKLQVSFVGYYSGVAIISCPIKQPLTITLKENISTLKAVDVNALSAEAIVNKVIGKLEQNYQAPAEYTLFTRETETGAQPVTLTEAVYKLQYFPKEKPRFNIIKVRTKAYSKRGKQRLNEARLITLHTAEALMMLRFGTDFLEYKKTKRYTYKLAGFTQYNNREYYVIEVGSVKNNYLQGGTIWVDPDTYGVAYLKKIWSDEKWRTGEIRSKTNNVDEIYYRQDGNKWYLSHSKESCKFGFAKGEPLHILTYTVATQRTAEKTFSKEEDMGLMSKMLKDFTGEFSDSFWENYNYIPLDSIYTSPIVID